MFIKEGKYKGGIGTYQVMEKQDTINGQFSKKIKFNIDDYVEIKELKIKGIIESISITRTNVYYQVRYFINGDLKSVFFISEELLKV